MQEVDAERRIQLLRGLKAEPASTPLAVESSTKHEGGSLKRDRKRRRIAGEDDTERDIRFAREDQAIAPSKPDLQHRPRKDSDAPLVDHKGHINLFPVDSKHHAPKNAEVEAEKAKKKKECEDQYTMRFSNAAGFKQSMGDKPWYQSMESRSEDFGEAPSKDVWGNEDPRRKERERMRVAADDPMAAMQKGVTQLRQVENERRKWQRERDLEIRELAEEQRRRKRRSKRPHDEKDLENFSLDASPKGVHRVPDERPRHHHRHRHRRRNGSRSRSWSRERRRSKTHSRHHRGRPDETNSKSGVERTPAWKPSIHGRYSSQFADAVA